jgi:hypothetical protein
MFVPGGLDLLCFSFAHNPTTLRDRRQSVGQLHGWSEGVASTHLPLGSFLRQGASAFDGLAAGQCLSYSSPLGFSCGTGEEVVRPRDVGLRRVAPVQFFQLVAAKQSSFSTKVVEYLPVLEDSMTRTTAGCRGLHPRLTVPA